MTANLRNTDRVLRLGVGILLLILPFVSGIAVFDSITATAVCGIVGLVMFDTSRMGFCPLNHIFGIRSCKL